MKPAGWLLLIPLIAWAPSVVAKLPQAVETGFKHLYLSITIFFAFAIASIFMSGVVARKVAPSSRDSRQLVMGLINILGLGVGAFVAFKVAR